MSKYCGCRRRGRSICRIPRACIVTRVKLLQDYSRECCILGKTFGIEIGSVWTSGGCQGKFWVCFDDGCYGNALMSDDQIINYGGGYGGVYGGGYGGGWGVLGGGFDGDILV